MRIPKIELEYSDLEWFAIDQNHKILRFTSGGYGAVPEFVCESHERTEVLCAYFEALPDITEGRILHRLARGFLEDYIAASRKGLYCFDACDGIKYTSAYTKITSPERALYYDDLPMCIRDTLKYNYLALDVDKADEVKVQNEAFISL